MSGATTHIVINTMIHKIFSVRCAQNNIQAILQTSLKSVRPKDRNACRRRMNFARRRMDVERLEPAPADCQSQSPPSALAPGSSLSPLRTHPELVSFGSISDDVFSLTTTTNLPSPISIEYNEKSYLNEWRSTERHAETQESYKPNLCEVSTNVTFENGTCVPISAIDMRYMEAEGRRKPNQAGQLPDSTSVTPPLVQGDPYHYSGDPFDPTAVIENCFDTSAVGIEGSQGLTLLDFHQSHLHNPVNAYDGEGSPKSLNTTNSISDFVPAYGPGSPIEYKNKPLPAVPIPSAAKCTMGSNSEVQASLLTPSLAQKYQKTRPELYQPSITNPNSQQQQQRISNVSKLRSFAKRLSYTSSQLEDIYTVFNCLSLSSQSIRISRASTAASDVVGGFTGFRPIEIDQNDIYFARQTLRLPGQVLQLHNSRLTSIINTPTFESIGYSYAFSELLTPSSELLNRNRIVPIDCFNNTSLHLTAARYASFSRLITFLDQEHYSLNRVNTGLQTFMHVLDPSSMIMDGFLPTFFTQLTNTGFNFELRDLQGSSVLHVLLAQECLSMIPGLEILSKVFAALADRLPAMAHRDNMGRTPQSQLLHLKRKRAHLPDSDDQRIDTILHKYYGIEYPLLYNAAIYEPRFCNRSNDENDILESLILRAIEEPGTEDQYGRNGLHCLAFLCGTTSESMSAVAPSARPFPSPERRELRDSPAAYFQKLLNRGVDVNAFDRTGLTPLLAMINNAPPGNGQEDRLMALMIKRLLDAGANPNLRGRCGVSPLHCAVRRGLIYITQQLLTAGANIQATDCNHYSIVILPYEIRIDLTQKSDEWGILGGMEITTPATTKHKNSITHQQRSLTPWKSESARIAVCKNLVIDRGAVECPTFEQEWSIRKGDTAKYSI